jgi:hypothetical protein
MQNTKGTHKGKGNKEETMVDEDKVQNPTPENEKCA